MTVTPDQESGLPPAPAVDDALLDEVRRYWDADSEVYDSVPNHHPTAAAELAAWTATLAQVLPPAPARVLDVGAGTGFLSLMAARLGHWVTAVDLSARMLERLRAKAAAEKLDIEVVEASAEDPPAGPFDAVIERHLLWTLPDPVAALRAWRAVAGSGRLVCFEGVWGDDDPVERLRRRARRALERVLRADARHSGHHGEYPDQLRAALPLGGGTTPSAVARLADGAGWVNPRLHRLRDIEWAASLDEPLAARLTGSSPRFMVVAGAGPHDPTRA